jgi:tungstate transport system substrate-binding protein
MRTLRLLLGLGLALAGCGAADDSPLLLATTTSVQDSGLLDQLLPRFVEDSGIQVHTIAVGSGAALRMGAEGNADVLLTHAPAGEQELVAAGAVVSRVPFMENHFVIAGPADDPAGVRDAGSALEVLRRIRAAGAAWVSRGDDSGTHRKERELLGLAGLDPEETWPGFTSTGSSMGLTLQVAGERRAYLLSDLGTFLAFRERTGLVAFTGQEPDLRNEYSLLRVSDEKFPGRVHGDGALSLERFLLSPGTQAEIAEFGSGRFGRPLFQPIAR